MNTSLDFKNKKIVILGLGRSGIGAANLACDLGAKVFGYDDKRDEDIDKASKELEKRGMIIKTEQYDSLLLKDADLLVISPGIEEAHPLIQEAKKKNIFIAGELEFASWFITKPIIAVTGTNGKTTTTKLIAHVFSKAGISCMSAGNIGTSLAAMVKDQNKYELFVVEVSSFQLETIKDFHPWISLILNITPDHLDRYADMNQYGQAKLRVAENQKGDDLIILNTEDELLMSLAKGNIHCSCAYFSFKEPVPFGAFFDGENIIFVDKKRKQEKIISIKDIQLKGIHNIENIMSAICVFKYYGLSNEKIVKGISSFAPVPHRMELVARINDVEFINDSKATNIDAVNRALLSFKEKVILIAGGRDKNMDFSLLRDVIKQKVKRIYLIGETKEKMALAWENTVPMAMCSSMNEAVAEAFKLAKPKDIILLSPACASFDMYKNYEQRGEHFKQEALSLR